jgi:ribonuclease HI
MVIYTDGGCAGNEQKDLTRRRMIAVATDERGAVLTETKQAGGSNNIAELLAVRDALSWCCSHKVPVVEIRTDSRNNFSWVLGNNVGEQVNDRDTVLQLK